MSLPGSCHVLADRARGAAAQLLSPLESAVIAECARVGGTNYQNDAQLAALIRKPNGESPHRESVGRARRKVTSLGFLEGERVFPGQKIPAPGARYRSAHGVVVSRIVWAALDMKNPLRRRERAAARAEQRSNVRAYEMIAPARPAPRAAEPAGTAQPRYSAAPVAAAPLPPELAELAERIGRRIDARETAREAAHDEAQVLAAEAARAGPD